MKKTTIAQPVDNQLNQDSKQTKLPNVKAKSMFNKRALKKLQRKLTNETSD